MSTCNDCIHCDVCKSFSGVMMGNNAGKLCGGFADKSRFIELPCKVGDTVYALCFGGHGYAELRVDNLHNLIRWMEDKLFGTEIFLTREEAEAAILKKQEKTNEKR